jgi:hypothetical protein
MPRVFDRRTGEPLGTLSADDLAMLWELMAEPSTADEEQYPIDPAALERLEAAGASPQLLTILRQMLEGRAGFDLGWEADVGA